MSRGAIFAYCGCGALVAAALIDEYSGLRKWRTARHRIATAAGDVDLRLRAAVRPPPIGCAEWPAGRVLLECEPQLVEHLLAAKGWAYDGDKILYTLGPMRLQMIELVVGRAPKETKVTIRQVSHHRMQELHTGSARRDDMRPVRPRDSTSRDP